MSWSSKRQGTIIFVIAMIIIIPIVIFVSRALYNPPSCFDNSRNGNESGVDCGGSCDLLCSVEIIDPIVVWNRFFEIAPGLYNTVAYVENPNPSAGTRQANYIFKLFDRESVLLYERKGSVRIPPKSIIPILENNLFTDQLEAMRISFEFTDDAVWEKEDSQDPVLLVQDEEIQDRNSTPRINAVIRNLSIRPVKDISVVAIVYDGNDNAIGSSSTFIERIEKDSSTRIVFTWLKPFAEDVARFEIIPIYEISS
jgi:hypothetical protein